MPAPVAYPIAERIVQNVVETLESISTHNGYLNDLLVEVQTPGGNPPIRDGLCVVNPGIPDPTEDARPINFDRYLYTITITAFAVESETHDPYILRGRLLSIGADIRRALKADIHRAGHAETTDFPNADQVDMNGSPPSVVVTPVIPFRTNWNDPYRYGA